MKKLAARIVLPLFCMGLLSGCGKSMPHGKGSISLNSTPGQAEVFVNGMPQGTTPTTISGLPADDYTVELKKAGYDRAFKNVSLMNGQRVNLNLEMKKVTGLLLVESNPEGADVLIDGVSKGRTPLLMTDLPLGSYKLEFSSTTHLPLTKSAELVDRKPVHVVAELVSNTARLTANSTPAGAEVRINGVLLGTTPTNIAGVVTGEADVKVSYRGYKPFQKRMVFEATQQYEISPELESLPSGLTVISTPEGAKVMVDNLIVGEAPITLSNLKGGDHEIAVSLEGFASQTTNIVLQPDMNESAEFNMVKDSGYLVLDTEPAGVQVYVDGILMATTQPKGGASTLSQPVRITLKADRDHKIQLVHDGYVSSFVNVTTDIDQIITRHEILKRIFVRDTMITTKTDVIKCRLEYKLPNGNIYFERFPGVFDTAKADDIVKVESIGLEDESNLDARRQIEQNRLAVPRGN